MKLHLLTASTLLAATLAPLHAQQVPAVAAANTAKSSAPIAPVSDGLMQNNPTRTTSIAGVFTRPHRAAGKTQASFEWANSSDIRAIALLNQYFLAFQTAPKSGGVGGGKVSLGYMNSNLGLGADLAINQRRVDPVLDDQTRTTFSPSMIGLFGSTALGDLVLNGRVEWKEPDSSTDVSTTNSGSLMPKVVSSTRHDSLGFTLGLRTYAKGDDSWAWVAQVGYGLKYQRPGQDLHSILANFHLGHRIENSEGFVFLQGVKTGINYSNAINAPDVRCEFYVTPDLSTQLPLFPNWVLKGGAALKMGYVYHDNAEGAQTSLDNTLATMVPSGSVGIRYERARWAAEAAVANDFLATGPWFMSGKDAASSPLVKLGITANFR